jgi:hypothetical protein
LKTPWESLLGAPPHVRISNQAPESGKALYISPTISKPMITRSTKRLSWQRAAAQKPMQM